MENNRELQEEINNLKLKVQVLKDQLKIYQQKAEFYENEKSANTFHKIAEKVSNFILLVDLNGVINYINKPIFNFDIKDLINKPISSIFDESNSILILNSIKHVYDTGKAIQIENSINSENFNEWLETTIELYSENNNQFVLTCNIISHHKQIENELLNSIENYEGIFNSVRQAIYIQNPDLTFIDVNESVTRLYGYEKEFFIGKTPEFLSAPNMNDFEKVVEICTKAFQGDTQNFMFWGLKKDGTIFPKDVWSKKGKYNGKDVLITVADDINERVKAETELLASELKYRTIVETTKEWMWERDLSGNLIFSNHSLEQILGYTLEEISKFNSYDLIYEEDKEIVISKMKNFISNKIGWENWIVRWVHKDNSIKYLESNASPIYDNLGNMIGYLGSDRDITERISTEARINETNERLLQFIDALPEAVFLKDADGRWQHINNVASELFQIGDYDWKGKTELEMSKDRLEFSKIHIDCFESDEKAWNSGDMFITHEIIPNKEHKDLIYEVRKIPVFDQDGSRNNLIVIGSDITQTKKIELLQKIQYNIANSVVASESLLELYNIVERELSRLFDTSNMFIATYNEKTDLITIQFERNTLDDGIKIWSAEKSLTGYLIKNKKPLLLSKDDISILERENKISKIGISSECWLGVPLIQENKTIGVIVLQSYTNPKEYDNESVSMLEVIANQLVLYLKQKQSEEMIIMLSKATENSPVSIVIADPSGTIEYVNNKFMQVTGYKRDEIIGLKPESNTSIIKQDAFFNQLWETIRNGKDWSGEICLESISGELVWENIWITRILNQDNQIQHYVALKEDISEIKKLLVDLSFAKEMAEENDLLKSAFLSNMSHEIRTPMNAIIGFSSLLDDETLTSDERKEFIKVINKKGNDLLNLINDILDLSKLESNQLKLFYTEDVINPLLFDLVVTFKNLIENSSLYESVDSKGSLIIKIGKTLPDNIAFTTDFSRLNQILTNLIANAVKFTSTGEVEFGCYSESKNYLTFYVKDTGIGIPKEKQELIFERFQQADSNFHTRKYGGTGLGLSIVKGLIDLLGGRIWMESQVNVGTTFYFSIPAVLINKNVNSDLNNLLEEKKDKLLILVAEDEISNYFLMENILKRNFKAEIYHAWNGQEAINYCKNNQNITLVLMDIKMPVLNGFEAFEKIREFNRDLPIVAITAYAMNEEKDKIISCGFNGYLPKPFKTDDLVNIINRIIKSKTILI